MPQGLPRKLRHAFILQAVTASFAIVIGMYVAGNIVSELLATQRLQSEADNYWSGRAADPDYRLPKTSTVNGYFVPAGGSLDALPGELRKFGPGVFELPDHNRRLLVDQHREGRLYLAMSFRLVDTVILWTSLLSALLALLVVHATSWLTYRRSLRLVEPVNQLAQEVSRWNPASGDANAFPLQPRPDQGREVEQLGNALQGLSTRVRDYIERERDFTHDASHELRTPLTVIRVATDMMLSDPDIPERAHRSLLRMQRAGRDMEAIIDAFLILARESEHAPLTEDFSVGEVIDDELEKVRPLLLHKPVELEVIALASPRLHASPRVLAVMLDQLLDNACRFTEAGRIEVRIESGRIVITDTGIGMTPEILQKASDRFYRGNQFSQSGKGMGLSIVRRLGERFDWPVTLVSTPGVGTVASIDFAGHLIS